MARKEILIKNLTGESLSGLDFKMGGSHYLSLFFPTLDEALSVDGLLEENTIDRYHKQKSLQLFFKEAKEGDFDNVEFVFASSETAQITTPEWQLISKNKKIFLGQEWVKSIQNFAATQIQLFQPKKSSNQIKKIILEMNKLTPEEMSLPFFRLCTINGSEVSFVGIPLESYTNEVGELMISFSGWNYSIELPCLVIRDKLRSIEFKLGLRESLDPKDDFSYEKLSSFLKAFKLLDNAKEAMLTGDISTPFRDIDYLNDVRLGKVDLDSAHEEMVALFSEVNQLHQTKWLPDNKKELDKLYTSLLKMRFKIK